MQINSPLNKTTDVLIEATDISTLRLHSKPEIIDLLNQLRATETPIKLYSPSSTQVSCVLWAIDEKSNSVSFGQPAHEPGLLDLVDNNEATAVAYLDSIKLQFELSHLMLVRSANQCALRSSLPKELFRFQRRNSFRVQPLSRTQPRAIFRHPMIADMQLELRVLDISLSGCALYFPHDMPELNSGVQLNDVRLFLDLSTEIKATLKLHHITLINKQPKTSRLGCELLALSHQAQAMLQQHIDSNQRYRRLMQNQTNS